MRWVSIRTKCLRLLVLAFYFIRVTSLAQLESSPEIESWEMGVIDAIEKQAGHELADDDYSSFIEFLRALHEDPINLNFASREELEQIPFLDDLLIYNLIAYRETWGALVSIYELQAIEGFDHVLIRNIQAFVVVEPVKKLVALKPKKVLVFGRHQFLFKIERLAETRKGYKNDPSKVYIGGPERIYLRYGFKYGKKIRFGITAEKDPGETFLSMNKGDADSSAIQKRKVPGFDYYSFHLMFSLSRIVKKIIIGDFHLQLGQGLSLWSGYAFGKPTEAIGIKKMEGGLKPHTGTDENRFFRGLATHLKLGPFQAIFFYSRNKSDATITEAFMEGLYGKQASPVQTGYHRTDNEILKKNALEVVTGGANIKFSNHRLKIGISLLNTSFEYPLEKRSALYSRFDASGNRQVIGGIDYHFLIRGINFFGEGSISRNGAYAMLHGFSTILHPRVSLGFLYRSYQRSYQNYFSNAFAESKCSNERGFYSGIKLQLSSKAMLNCYMDAFGFPWLKFRTDKPSHGSELSASIDYTLNQEVNIRAAIRQKQRQYNQLAFNRVLNSIYDFKKTNFQAQIDYKIGLSLWMRNRIEFITTYIPGNQKHGGFLFYHDIKWKTKNERISISLRYAVFDTDTYDERIYAYEQDVLYSFTVPAYYYRGVKGVFLSRVRFSNRLSGWVRISRIWYADLDKIGSGADEVNRSHLTQLKIQLLLKLGSGKKKDHNPL